MAVFNVGDRVRITNPKVVKHLTVGDMRSTGTVRSIDPTRFAERPKVWADDVPQYIRDDTDPVGYYVQLDDNPLNTRGIAYRAIELDKEKVQG